MDTLRLDEAQTRQLLERLEALSRCNPVPHDGRAAARVSFEYGAKSVVQIIQPAGTVESFLVYLRNLSETGIGFLHGGFLHPDSRCRVLLRQTDGRAVSVPGRIVRCHHAAGRVHEIGVHFDAPIVLSRYIAGFGEGLISPLWDDPEMRPMVARFLEQLGDTIGQARKAARSDWAQVCRLCSGLRSSARSFGYDPISHAAEKLCDAIAAAASVDAMNLALSELVELATGARRAVGLS